MDKMYKIVIDAMGSDNAPEPEVKGALLALDLFNDIEITLVGNEELIRPLLNGNEKIKIIHTDEVITTMDDPARSMRRKPNSSLALAMTQVKEGNADAILSAGSTGAVLAGGIFVIGRINGVERPALAPILPTINYKGVVLTDAGASADARPEMLVNYAIMGSVYASAMNDIEEPKVALLNIGAESKKGTDLYKESYKLLSDNESINFQGNIEGRDILSGDVDVIVCDGFTGNIALKTVEGTAKTVFNIIKTELKSKFISKLAASFMLGSFKRVKKRLDYTETGGALFIGCNAPVIKAHGSSNDVAIKNAIRQARTIIEADMVSKIKSKIEGN